MMKLYCHPVLNSKLSNDWRKLAIPKGSKGYLNPIEREQLWTKMCDIWKKYKKQHPSQQYNSDINNINNNNNNTNNNNNNAKSKFRTKFRSNKKSRKSTDKNKNKNKNNNNNNNDYISKRKEKYTLDFNMD